MIASTDTWSDSLVEFDERESNGIPVTLVWNRDSDGLATLVWDERTEESFTVEITPRHASDVFHIPSRRRPSVGLTSHELPAEAAEVLGRV